MVERWSSKPFAWVRFLLPLMSNLKPTRFLNNNTPKNFTTNHSRFLKIFRSKPTRHNLSRFIAFNYLFLSKFKQFPTITPFTTKCAQFPFQGLTKTTLLNPLLDLTSLRTTISESPKLVSNSYSLISNYVVYPLTTYNKFLNLNSRLKFNKLKLVINYHFVEYLNNLNSFNYLDLPSTLNYKLLYYSNFESLNSSTSVVNKDVELMLSKTYKLALFRSKLNRFFFTRKLFRIGNISFITSYFLSKRIFLKLNARIKSLNYFQINKINKQLLNTLSRRLSSNLNLRRFKLKSYNTIKVRVNNLRSLHTENLYFKFFTDLGTINYSLFISNTKHRQGLKSPNLSPTTPIKYIKKLSFSKTDFLFNSNYFTSLMLNSNLLKYTLLNNKLLSSQSAMISSNLTPYTKYLTLKLNLDQSNLYPAYNLRLKNFRKSFAHLKNSLVVKDFGRWANLNSVKFLEHLLGQKILVKTYPFLLRSVSPEFISIYYMWAPRLTYYARRLGHRFFLLESLLILHISLYCRDSMVAISWLKSMIKRISFWKTRVIFRFIRYVFTYMFSSFFNTIGAKGFKVKLKGKISSAGNSRKRSIMYRFGKCSYSSVNNKCLYSMETVNTFTGVLGLQLWIFY